MERPGVLVRLAETLGPVLIRTLGHTLHARILPRTEAGRRRRVRETSIYAFWHGRMLIPAFTHRHRGIGILVSRHRDGEYIARVVARLGFEPLRGSTTRGGVAGLRAMIAYSRTGRDLAFTPDGPRGPRYVVQPGVIYAASRTGLPIVPVAIEADPAWVLGSWDEFTIPKPFARAVVIEGPSMRVPRHLPGDLLEEHRSGLEREMHRLMAEAKRIARETRSPHLR